MSRTNGNIATFFYHASMVLRSKIKIPFYPVPMTMQTFVVLFIGVAFGWKLGVATVSLYLFEGIIGLPVFSGTPEKGLGIVYFTGPTMGYLIGFLFTIFLAGYFSEIRFRRRPPDRKPLAFGESEDQFIGIL